MKKLLQNNKSVNCVLLLMLLCANSISSQTVVLETFGTTAVPVTNNYSGATSSPSVSYLTNVAGYTSVDINGIDGYLNFMPNTTTGANRVSLVGALPTGSGMNGALRSNTNLITWNFNMKASRLSTNIFSSSTGYLVNKYFSGVVLCSTTGTVISNGSSPGTGYAITVQKSANNANTGKASVYLIKFSNGIGDVVGESSVVTKLIESPELAQIPSSITTSNNLSIKVTYNPTVDVWELFYREDPIIPTPISFVDPSTGTFTLGGSFTDVPPTTPMTSYGFVAGLQSSTSTANSYQFDNFKISLSAPPAYTSPPTIANRQVFNATTNPIVGSLVATGSNIKWYSAATGGTAIAASTPLNYVSYYGSQTVNNVESTRIATQAFVGDTNLKTLPLYESFASYTVGDKLIQMNNGASAATLENPGTGLGSWSITPSTNITDDVLIVTSPTWSNTVLPTAAGNAISFVGSGIDPELKFTNTTSGNLFSSFVLNVVDAPVAIVASTTTNPSCSVPTGFYSFSSDSVDPVTSLVNTNYAADVMFRKNIATGKYNIGLSKSNNGDECVWSTTEFDFNTQHVVVISYENIGNADALQQVAKLWIDPAATTQPSATLSQNNPTTSITRTNLDRIKLLQASSTSTPTIIIDEIRVANNWSQALGGAALGLENNSISNLSIYPNPVSNGKLFISSASNLEKEVQIFNTLGQHVLQAKTITEALNVSNLNKGTYFVKITEAGISATKKLIIQ
jgi:hypothetical protein